MGKTIRVIILISVLLGTIGLAQRQAAWAQSSVEDEQSIQFDASSPAALPDENSERDRGGTVRPPQHKDKICKRGTYSLRGTAVVRVRRLAHDYCLTAALRKRSQDKGNIPPGAGKLLADVTDIQFFHRRHRIGVLPESKGAVEICYALPPGRHGQIYFRAYGETDWKPLITTFVKGAACAPAQISGSYALIGN